MNRTMSGRDEQDAPDAGFGESSRYAAHLDRGWALLDKGELEAARTSVQHAQDVRPDDPDAALLLGAIALAEGDAPEALRCYDRAIELDGDYLEPYAAAAAVCLYDLDDAVRGLRYASEALEIDDLAPLELIDLQLIAAECELVGEDVRGAHERLAELPETAVLEAGLELASTGAEPSADDDPARLAAHEFLSLDAEGELLEEDERTERGQRAVGLALRLGQAWMDSRHENEAHALLRKLVEWFPRDPEAWSLVAELEFRRGQLGESARAACKTLELDAEIPLPEFVPTPAVVHRRIVGTLAHCGEPKLAALVEGDRSPTILVRDLPPAEMLLEGTSPRIAVLATASRDPEGEIDGPASLTGLVVYRKNLAKFVRDADGFDEELRYAVLEELAMFFGLSAKSRRNLGLDPSLAPEPVSRGEESLIDAKPRRRKASPRKRKD